MTNRQQFVLDQMKATLELAIELLSQTNDPGRTDGDKWFKRKIGMECLDELRRNLDDYNLTPDKTGIVYEDIPF